jgi:hypothetical protein
MQKENLSGKTFPLLFFIFLILLGNPMVGIATAKPGYLFSGWHNGKQDRNYFEVGVSNPDSGETKIKFKSEAQAFRWSLFGTLVPISAGLVMAASASGSDEDPVIPLTLMGSGLIIGPSLGYFYGGLDDRGMKGMVIRFGIETAVVGVSLIVLSSVKGDFLDNVVAAVAVLGAGQALVLAHGIYDIAKVKGEVRKCNQSFKGTALILSPKFFPNSKIPGIQAQILF